MVIDVSFQHVERSDALEMHIRDRLAVALAPFADRITRIDVHLEDQNGRHRNTEGHRRCLIEARPAGYDPIAVREDGDDWYGAVSTASGKLRRALEHRLRRAG